MSEVTQVLEAMSRGDARAAEELLSLVYAELRKLAAAKMAHEAPGHTLQPTALVHEAWLRLGGNAPPAWQNRAHFFSAAGEAMRRILIRARARRRQRLRHGGGQERVDIAELEIAAPEDDQRLLSIHELLDALAKEEPAKADVVKLRFFVGLSEREIAEALGVTERTVERHWACAKVWLLRAMQQTP
jgi:RNA polymerase sigma factor (TIGR02999 family)